MRRRALLTGGALFVLAGAILWIVRATLAENLVNDQLEQRDVAASYRIESIGPRTQRLADVVIGDPKNPDLIARMVEIDVCERGRIAGKQKVSHVSWRRTLRVGVAIVTAAFRARFQSAPRS